MFPVYRELQLCGIPLLRKWSAPRQFQGQALPARAKALLPEPCGGRNDQAKTIIRREWCRPLPLVGLALGL